MRSLILAGLLLLVPLAAQAEPKSDKLERQLVRMTEDRIHYYAQCEDAFKGRLYWEQFKATIPAEIYDHNTAEALYAGIRANDLINRPPSLRNDVYACFKLAVYSKQESDDLVWRIQQAKRKEGY